MQATALKARPRDGKGILQGLSIGAGLGVILSIYFTLSNFLKPQGVLGTTINLFFLVFMLGGFIFAGFRGSFVAGKVWVGTISGLLASVAASAVDILLLFVVLLIAYAHPSPNVNVGFVFYLLVLFMGIAVPIILLVVGAIFGTIGGTIGKWRASPASLYQNTSSTQTTQNQNTEQYDQNTYTNETLRNRLENDDISNI